MTALSKIPDTTLLQYEDSINFLEYAMNPETPFDMTGRRRVVSINNDLLQLEAQSIFIGICELLIPVDESALKNFRTEFLPSLRVISKGLSMWSRDETSLKSQDKNISSQMLNLLMEYSVFAGEKNKEFMSEKDALLSMLTRSGMSKAEAQIYIDKLLANSQKSAVLDDKKKDIDDLQKTLEGQKQLLREKTAPKEGDDPYLVWGKALRFLTVKMYEDAISALQFYLLQVKDTDKDAPVYVPAAINFIKSISSTGIDYGVLVAAYEPGKPQHSVYKIGDIIVAINKMPCKNTNDFKKIRGGIPSDSSYKASILRPDEKGILKIIDLEIPEGQPKIAIMSLKESE